MDVTVATLTVKVSKMKSKEIKKLVLTSHMSAASLLYMIP